MRQHALVLEPIGFIRSELTSRSGALLQGCEGAPDAWLELLPRFTRGLEGISVGSQLTLVTWLHLADRATLRSHPRGDPSQPLKGVFATRSPDRPNPIGLHPVTVKEICGNRLRLGPLEAIDGTPVIDVKSTLSSSDAPQLP